MAGLDNDVYKCERDEYTLTSPGEFTQVTDGTNTICQIISDGSPEGVHAADIGSIAYDATNAEIYIKETDTVNTGWKQITNAAPTVASGVQNLGMDYDAGTGVFTIQGATADLSSTNVGRITTQSQSDSGKLVNYEITANQSFIDDNGSSEIIGNLFGHTTGRATDQDIPFWIYAVPNDAEDAIQFMISRVPHLKISPAAANIGAPDDAVADAQNDMWSFDNIDETLYESNPAFVIGCFRMRMSASDDWTVQTLDTSIDGIGQFFESKEFITAKGHYGADASSNFIAGAGTVPSWTTESPGYFVSLDGNLKLNYFFVGDGGTDGAGAVPIQTNIPMFGPNVYFPAHLTSPATAGGTGSPISCVPIASNHRILQWTNVANYNYSAFTNGNRFLGTQAIMPIEAS